MKDWNGQGIYRINRSRAPRKILAGHRHAGQPANNPKDRWTETPKKVLKTVGWKKNDTFRNLGKDKQRLWPHTGTAALLKTHSILTWLITRKEFTVSYPC
jgi:hypothetical protein